MVVCFADKNDKDDHSKRQSGEGQGEDERGQKRTKKNKRVSIFCYRNENN